MKNIKKSKIEEMNKNWEKMKKTGGKKVGKKGKEGPKGAPPEMGSKIDFSHNNCQEKS